MIAAAGSFWFAMVSAIVQTTLVASIALIAVSVRPRWSAPVRHAMLLIALARFAMPVGLSLIPIRIRGEFDIARHVSAQPATWKLYLVLFYLAGCLIAFGMTFERYRRLGRLARAAEVVTSGEMFEVFRSTAAGLVRRTPRLLLTDEKVSPMSFGVVRRFVLISRTLVEQLDRDQLRIVFAHELVHHRRGDLLIGHVQTWLAVAWWFDPFFHAVSRAIERVREEACDDFLLARQITTDEAYSTLLLAASGSVAPPAFAIPVTAMAHRGTPLTRRIRRILTADLQRRDRISTLAFGLIFGAALVALLNFYSPGLSRSPSPSPSPTPSDSPSDSPSPSPSPSR